MKKNFFLIQSKKKQSKIIVALFLSSQNIYTFKKNENNLKFDTKKNDNNDNDQFSILNSNN